VELTLEDGRKVRGTLVERTLLDSAAYAPRFEAHSRSSAFVPFAMGETLYVTLRDGREWTAPFAGYAELTLLLRSPESRERTEYLRVPFEFVTGIRGADGDAVEPADLARAFHSDQLPSAEALVLEERQAEGWNSVADSHRRAVVPVEDIELATLATAEGIGAGGVVGVIVVSAILGAILAIFVIGQALNDAEDKCGASSRIDLGTPSSVTLTTRPFDLQRGAFVGDTLATADGWLGTMEQGLAKSLADPAGGR
jgi:hypothetical protein